MVNPVPKTGPRLLYARNELYHLLSDIPFLIPLTCFLPDDQVFLIRMLCETIQRIIIWDADRAVVDHVHRKDAEGMEDVQQADVIS